MVARDGLGPVEAFGSIPISRPFHQPSPKTEDMNYRKKPIVIQAVQWDGKLTTIEPLMAGSNQPTVEQELCDPALIIQTLEGRMRAEVGDWIIRGVKGELYPCKPDIFAATYEPVKEAR